MGTGELSGSLFCHLVHGIMGESITLLGSLSDSTVKCQRFCEESFAEDSYKRPVSFAELSLFLW